MSEKVVITKEMLLTARDYVPNAVKEAWVGEKAKLCFDRLEIKADGEKMPNMFLLNTGLKARYLMTALIDLYFRLEYEQDENDAGLMSEDDYDRWAGSHAINQIERLKSDAEARNKCFDLLSDYKDLEKRFSSQLNGLLAVQNDTVLRTAEYAKTQSTEAMPELAKALQELGDYASKKEVMADDGK